MKRYLTRLWPQSLVGQTIALFILALLGSHLISFMIFTDERHLALLQEKRENIYVRIVSIVRLLEDTPSILHERILEATNNQEIHFYTHKHSAIDTDKFEYFDNFSQQRLLQLLGNAYADKVLVQETHYPFKKGYKSTHHHFWDWHQHDEEFEKPEKFDWHNKSYPYNKWETEHYYHHKKLKFIVAIALNTGQWLNIKIYQVPPPRLLVLSALLSTLLTAIALIVIVIFMLKRINRPLVALTTASDKLGRGEVPPWLPEQGSADIRQTIRAFNQMNQRLQRFVQDRTRMLAAISHDLRTPITILRLRTEFIEDSDTRTKILATLEEMQAMTEATLAFAREAATQEDTRRVDLTALVASLCDDLADMGQQVQFREGKQWPYSCRPVSLKRALRNLIENAIRYGQRARVAIQATKTELHITINDDGSGIPVTDLERVFEPFVRLESSRNRETGGIGLGMSIARSIVHGHGGEIILNNQQTGGLQVIVTLPLKN